MLTVITTPVLMTDEDAKKFVLFQKYYNVFSKLDEVNALGIKFGKCTINFFNGEIQNVVKEEVVYHKG
jgi:hypothetical protein